MKLTEFIKDLQELEKESPSKYYVEDNIHIEHIYRGGIPAPGEALSYSLKFTDENTRTVIKAFAYLNGLKS